MIEFTSRPKLMLALWEGKLSEVDAIILEEETGVGKTVLAITRRPNPSPKHDSKGGLVVVEITGHKVGVNKIPFINTGVIIDESSIVFPNVVLLDSTRIGKKVTIAGKVPHPGSQGIVVLGQSEISYADINAHGIISDSIVKGGDEALYNIFSSNHHPLSLQGVNIYLGT